MTPEQIEQIINTLIERLGPIGGQVWSIYVRQVYVDVFGGALWMVGFLMAALACWRLIRRCEDIEDHADYIFAKVGAYAGVVVCLLLAFCAFVFDVLKAINPQYHAIQMLLGR